MFKVVAAAKLLSTANNYTPIATTGTVFVAPSEDH